MRLRQRLFHGGGEFEAGHLGHLDVRHDDIGHRLETQVETLATVLRPPDDLDVLLDFQQGHQRPEHHRLILDHDHADRHQAGSGARGRVISMRVPERPSRTRLPPKAAMRSRMPSQAIALATIAAGAIVHDFEKSDVVPVRQTHPAGLGVGVPQDIGRGFAQYEGQRIFVREGEGSAAPPPPRDATPAVWKAFFIASNSAERPEAR